jgi:hypothetical protein
MDRQLKANQAAFDIGQMTERMGSRLLHALGGNSVGKGRSRSSPECRRSVENRPVVVDSKPATFFV